MDRASVLQLLSAVERGELSPSIAADTLSKLPFEDIGDARIDHHRALRSGLPEVIYGAGKTPSQVAAIFLKMTEMGGDVLATRVSSDAVQAVLAVVPQAVHHATAAAISLRQSSPSTEKGHVAVLCAGTSDLAVAEEARVTAEAFGCKVTPFYDIGVAGLPRLLAVREQINAADVLVVCAGMEGALPSVVGGMVSVPVIAVPTSVGYGGSFGGVTALLGMLNSCSPNVSVVNIDNGFGAAYSATLIARAAAKGRARSATD